jgi:hypothetical protein
MYSKHGMVVGLLPRGGFYEDGLRIDVLPDAAVFSIYFVQSIDDWAAEFPSEFDGPSAWHGYGTYP